MQETQEESCFCDIGQRDVELATIDHCKLIAQVPSCALASRSLSCSLPALGTFGVLGYPLRLLLLVFLGKSEVFSSAEKSPGRSLAY
jgi:hypothetical protein